MVRLSYVIFVSRPLAALCLRSCKHKIAVFTSWGGGLIACARVWLMQKIILKYLNKVSGLIVCLSAPVNKSLVNLKRQVSVVLSADCAPSSVSRWDVSQLYQTESCGSFTCSTGDKVQEVYRRAQGGCHLSDRWSCPTTTWAPPSLSWHAPIIIQSFSVWLSRIQPSI